MISTVLVLTHQGYGSFCNFFQRLSRRSIDVTRIELISLALQCHHILLSFIVYLDLGCHSFGLLLLLNCIIVKVVWWNITLSLMVVWRRGSTLLQEVLSDMSAALTVTIGILFAKPLNEVRHYVWHHHHCLRLIAYVIWLWQSLFLFIQIHQWPRQVEALWEHLIRFFVYLNWSS